MTDPQAGQRLIFVGGAPRSGTTLLQNMLDSHPNIVGGPEFLHLSDIIGVRNKLQASIEKDWITAFCSGEQADRLTSQYIENLLLPLADKHQATFLSEKTPGNVLVFKELLYLFPKARFIQIIRDPRATIASMLQVGLRAKKNGKSLQRFTTSVSAAINHVQQCIEAGFDAADQAPDRVLTLVYGELVSNPKNETEKICNFLGVEWSERMMHPGRYEHPGEEAITAAETWYDTNAFNRNPQTTEIYKWRKHLTQSQQVWIATAFENSPELKKLGYNFFHSDVSPWARLMGQTLFKVRSSPATSNLRRGVRKIRRLSYT